MFPVIQSEPPWHNLRPLPLVLSDIFQSIRGSREAGRICRTLPRCVFVLCSMGGHRDVLRLQLHTVAWALFSSCSCRTGAGAAAPPAQSIWMSLEKQGCSLHRQLQFQSELQFHLSITSQVCRGSICGLEKVWTAQKYCWADMKCSGVCVCVQSDLSAPAHQWYVQHQENYEYIHRNPTFICFGFIPPWCCWCRQKSLEHVWNRSLHRGVLLVWSYCNVHVKSEDRISKAQAAEECCESFNAGTSADLWHLSTEDDLEIILSIILFCDAVKNFTPCAQDETWHFSNEELQFHQYKNFP